MNESSIPPRSRRKKGAAAGATRAAVQRQGMLLLVFCAGAGALSWEILWQLHITLAVGISAVGTAITLATTMLGMTLGSLWMGRLLAGRRVENPARLYGLLELAVGLSGLAMPVGFAVVAGLDETVYLASPMLAPALQLAAIVVLLGPPTLAMGATLPVFPLVARRHDLSISLLYGLNTAGAALGVLLISFLALPALGALHAGVIVVCVNLAVFGATRLYRVAAEDVAAASAEPEAVGRASRMPLALASALVFATGFATFGLEVAWFRSLRAAFQATTESFAIILASVLLPLAVGARLVPALRRRGTKPALAMACAGVAILLVTPLVERMDLFVWALQLDIGDYLGRLVVASAILGPPMLCLGVVLPFCLEEFSDPAEVARLYAINTLASVLGSLLAAWLLLPHFGFARTAWLMGVLVVSLACVAAGRGALRIWIGLAGALAVLVAVTATASLGRDRVQVMDAERAHHRLIDFSEGPDATVSVVEDEHGERLLVIDGFVASSERKLASYMEWMGRLPMLLHPAPRRALVICFGTGETAHSVLSEGAERLDIVDLNASVFEMAHHFHRNQGVLGDPRVHSVVMDGRAWVRRDPARYDVVTLEPMPPHFAGVNALYSIEFYRDVATRLEPGGVVAQWVPFHILPAKHAASIAATFQAVFPDAALWVDPSSRTGILLGRAGGEAHDIGEAWPGLDRTRLERSLAPEAIRGALELDSEALARFASPGAVITDDNQLLSYSLISREIARSGIERLLDENIERVAQAAGRAADSRADRGRRSADPLAGEGQGDTGREGAGQR